MTMPKTLLGVGAALSLLLVPLSTFAQDVTPGVGASADRSGSVRARASQYNLCSRTCGDVPSRGFHDGQHRHGPPEVEQSLAVGGNVLVMGR